MSNYNKTPISRSVYDAYIASFLPNISSSDDILLSKMSIINTPYNIEKNVFVQNTLTFYYKFKMDVRELCKIYKIIKANGYTSNKTTIDDYPEYIDTISGHIQINADTPEIHTITSLLNIQEEASCTVYNTFILDKKKINIYILGHNVEKMLDFAHLFDQSKNYYSNGVLYNYKTNTLPEKTFKISFKVYIKKHLKTIYSFKQFIYASIRFVKLGFTVLIGNMRLSRKFISYILTFVENLNTNTTMQSYLSVQSYNNNKFVKYKMHIKRHIVLATLIEKRNQMKISYNQLNLYIDYMNQQYLHPSSPFAEYMLTTAMNDLFDNLSNNTQSEQVETKKLHFINSKNKLIKLTFVN